VKSPETVRAFDSPTEFERFRRLVDELVEQGVLLATPTDPGYRHGEVIGGAWFIDVATSATWRLVAPDFPFRGCWERIVSPSQEPAGNKR